VKRNVDVKISQINQKRIHNAHAEKAFRVTFTEDDDLKWDESVLLLRKYGRQGDWRRVLSTFDKIKKNQKEMNVIVINQVLHGLVYNGQMAEAERVFKEQIVSGNHEPDVATFTTLIHGYSKGIHQSQRQQYLQRAESMVKVMKSRGIEPTAHTWNSLMVCYNQCKRFKDSRAIFDTQILHSSMKQDQVYTTAIRACEGFPEKGWEYYLDLVKSGYTPNIIHFGALLRLAEEPNFLFRVLAEMKRLNVEIDSIITYNIIMNCLLKNEMKKEADAVIAKIQGMEWNEVTFAFLIERAWMDKKWHDMIDYWIRGVRKEVWFNCRQVTERWTKIDLHRLTIPTAIACILEAVQNCNANAGLTFITGRGNHTHTSAGGKTIASEIPAHLQKHFGLDIRLIDGKKFTMSKYQIESLRDCLCDLK